MTLNPIVHHPKNVLVTGASGFIGSNLVRVLLAEGYHVRALVEPNVGTENLNGLDVELVEGDLRDNDSLRAAVQGRDTVYHLAAIFDYWLPEPKDMFVVNVEGTVNLMNAARDAGVRRVIKCSSIAAIGGLPGEEAANEEVQFNDWHVADDYALSKYIAEAEALRFNSPQMNVVVGMPCFPYGRNDITPTPTGMLAERYVLGQNPMVFTGGINAANVRDVAYGFHLCGIRGRAGERYILGGHNVTYQQLVDVLCKYAGSKPPTRVMDIGKLAWLGSINELISKFTKKKPYFIAKGMRYISNRHFYFDLSKSKSELGYSPTSFEATMEETVRWFKDERARVQEGEMVHGVDERREKRHASIEQPVVKA